MNNAKNLTAVLLCLALGIPAPLHAQNAAASQASEAGAAKKYQISILEDASQFRRARRGRASSQAAVKVTDENNVPVAGIAVTFTIPQVAASGATFVNGAATAMTVTNAAGVASTGVSVGAGTSAFNLSVVAAVPGQTLSAAIPVNVSAATAAAGGSAAGAGAGGGGGSGAGLGIGAASAIVGGIAGAVVIGLCATGKCGNGSDRVSIGRAGAPTIGPPR